MSVAVRQFKNVMDVQDLSKLQQLRNERMKATTAGKPRQPRARGEKPAAETGPVSLTPGN